MDERLYYFVFILITGAGMYGLKTDIPYSGWVLFVGLVGLISKT